MIGSAEIARRETTVSQSLGGRLSQSTSTQEREVTKRLVLDSEILALPEREGYLFAAGFSLSAVSLFMGLASVLAALALAQL